MLNRTTQPPIKPISKITFPTVEKTALANGLPLHLIQDDAQEIVRLDFMFACGLWQQSKPLVAFFANQMLKEGTENLSSQQIAEKLDFYGSSLQLSSSYHFSYLTVYSLTKYVNETLAVVDEMLKRPSFPIEEFEVLRNNRRQQFLLDQEKVQVLASKKFGECLYGTAHPYGKSAVLEDFNQFSLEEVKAFYKDNYTLSNCQIIVSGNIEAALLTQLSSLFGEEPLLSQIVKDKSFAKVSAELKTHRIPKADTVQAAVKIGRVGISLDHPDFHPMKVLSTIFGGYFGSRLMSTIREEKGYTYGIHSSLTALKDGGSFSITTETATKYVEPLIAEVYNEMDKLCIELVSDEELTMVKNFMLGEAARVFDGTFSMANICLSLLANNKEVSFYEKQIETIRTISSAQIQSLAKKYLVKEEFYEIIAG